jgi:CheY-like chemotaxis protein
MDERPSVLIVDDDGVIREALRVWLEDSGYPVLEAEDGIAALYILDHTQSDVVIVTDYAMPQLDGRALIDFVTHSAELSKRTTFVYMTAGTRILSPVFSGELQELGVPVLRKPFDLEALTRTVAEAEAQLRTRRALPAAPEAEHRRDAQH